MPTGRRGDGLPIEDDPAHHRRVWAFERIGWALMAVVVVAALLGVFGNGPLTRTTASAPDESLRVEYARVVRHGGETALTLHLPGQQTAGEEVRIWLSGEYLDGVHVLAVTPEPVRFELASDGQVWVFRVAERGAPAAVVIRIDPDGYGSLAGAAAIAGRPAAAFGQFVMP